MPGTAPSFTSNTADPGPTNDTNSGYKLGDLWLNTIDGKFFECRDNAANSAKWALLNSVLTPRDFGALGNGATDDSAPVMISLMAARTANLKYSVFLPQGNYPVSDTIAGNANTQVVAINGTPSTGTFTLTVTSFGLGAASSTQTTAPISPTAYANRSQGTPNVQGALSALTNVGSNVTVDGPAGGGPPWVVTFGPALKGAVMSFTPPANLPSPYVLYLGNANIQTVTAPASGTFTLPVTATGISGATATQTTAAIAYNAPASGGANSVQYALGQLTNVTPQQVWVTSPSAGTYTVYFSPRLGAPAMSGNGAGVSISQSGAAIILSGIFGLRLIGEGPSASNLTWHPANGSIGGIMLSFEAAYGYLEIEHLQFLGRSGAGNQARLGILLQGSGATGGSESSIRDCSFWYFYTPQLSANPPLRSSCVQFGINPVDSLSSEGLFDGCDFNNVFGAVTPTGVGVRHLNFQSVNFQWVSCHANGLQTAVVFEGGGNFQWLGGSVEGCSTILQIGSTAVNYGGGLNASTFILQNIRSESGGVIRPNTTIVNAGYLAAPTNIIIEGWNDVYNTSNLTDPNPAIILGAGANVTMRNSQVWRASVTGLAVEVGVVYSVTMNNTGNNYTSPPTVVFAPPPAPGVTAEGIALVGGLKVGSANATGSITFNGGLGYQGPPSVSFQAPPVGGTSPQAYTLLNPLNGAVSDVIVTYSGSGYTSSPITVTFSAAPPGQTTATGHGNPALQQVTGVAVTVPGSNYQAQPAVSFTGGGTGSGAGGTGNITIGFIPSPTAPASLRLENVTAAANLPAMCVGLSTSTKVDIVGGGVPEISTVFGHFRYSPLGWLLLQLNPVVLMELGEVGQVAANQGSGYYIGGAQTYNDGQYTGTLAAGTPVPLMMTQNAQGIVASDAIGGFNTRPPGSTAPTGYVTFPPAGPAIVGQTLSNLRNDYTGMVGFEFQTPNAPVIVSQLARWVVSGNVQSHQLEIVDSVSPYPVVAGPVTVNTSGQPVGYKYQPLTAPVTLLPNHVYFMVSQETAGMGQDQWYNGSPVTPTADISVLAIVDGSGTTWSAPAMTANNSFGPENFQYIIDHRFGPQPGAPAWSFEVVVVRNSINGTHPILSTLGNSGAGGLEVQFEPMYNKLKVIFDNGQPTNARQTFWSNTQFGTSYINVPIYVLVVVDFVKLTVSMYFNGNTTADSVTPFTMGLFNNSVNPPLIGFTNNNGVQFQADLQLSRMGVYNTLISPSTFQRIYNAGTKFGR